jgi:hypothetical protein
MFSREDNETITQVGPGTQADFPAGLLDCTDLMERLEAVAE